MEQTEEEKKAIRLQLRKEAAASVREVGEETKRLIEWRKPAATVQIIEALAEGKSSKFIREKWGLDWGSLCRIRTRHEDLIRRRREVIAEDALELAEGTRMLAMDKMAMMSDDPEMLAATPLRDLALSYGIFTDKHILATDGGNKMIVEHQGAKAVSLADAVKAIEEAKALLRVKRESIEITVSEPAGVSTFQETLKS
jgi:hypothetical protein